MKTNMKFENWFTEQFGKRPSPKHLDDKLGRELDAGVKAARLLDECHQYDYKKQAAKYAWAAKGIFPVFDEELDSKGKP